MGLVSKSVPELRGVERCAPVLLTYSPCMLQYFDYNSSQAHVSAMPTISRRCACKHPTKMARHQHRDPAILPRKPQRFERLRKPARVRLRLQGQSVYLSYVHVQQK